MRNKFAQEEVFCSTQQVEKQIMGFKGTASCPLKRQESGFRRLIA